MSGPTKQILTEPSAFVYVLRNAEPELREEYLRRAHTVDREDGKAFGEGHVFLPLKNCLSNYFLTADRDVDVANIYRDIVISIIDLFPGAVADAGRPTKDEGGDIALHLAARCGCQLVVERLLRRLQEEDAETCGRALRCTNDEGRIQLAIAVGYMDQTIVGTLLEADPRLAESMTSPLHMVLRALGDVEYLHGSAAGVGRSAADVKSALAIIDLFVQKSGSGVLDRTDNEGRSPFVKAQYLERDPPTKARPSVPRSSKGFESV